MLFFLFLSFSVRFLKNRALNKIKHKLSDESIDYFIPLKAHKISTKFSQNKVLNKIKRSLSDESVDYFVPLGAYQVEEARQIEEAPRPVLSKEQPNSQKQSNPQKQPDPQEIEAILKSKQKNLPQGQIFLDEDIHQAGKDVLPLNENHKKRQPMK
jgi:hypothetical protein